MCYKDVSSPPNIISALVIVPICPLQHVPPVLLNLILNLEMRNFPMAGRLVYLLKSNPEVLERVSGLKIDLNLEQTQKRLLQQIKMSFQDLNLVKTILGKAICFD